MEASTSRHGDLLVGNAQGCLLSALSQQLGALPFSCPNLTPPQPCPPSGEGPGLLLVPSWLRWQDHLDA